jgi:hypothetical protein
MYDVNSLLPGFMSLANGAAASMMTPVIGQKNVDVFYEVVNTPEAWKKMREWTKEGKFPFTEFMDNCSIQFGQLLKARKLMIESPRNFLDPLSRLAEARVVEDAECFGEATLFLGNGPDDILVSRPNPWALPEATKTLAMTQDLYGLPSWRRLNATNAPYDDVKIPDEFKDDFTKWSYVNMMYCLDTIAREEAEPIEEVWKKVQAAYSGTALVSYPYMEVTNRLFGMYDAFIAADSVFPGTTTLRVFTQNEWSGNELLPDDTKVVGERVNLGHLILTMQECRKLGFPMTMDLVQRLIFDYVASTVFKCDL